jgi:putative ABC transport system permease protein
VTSVRPPESNDASGRTQRVLEFGLKRADFEELQTLPRVEKVIALRETRQQVVIEGTRFNINAIATTQDIFDVINLRLDRGTFFTQEQVEKELAVAVVGAQAALQMFPHADPIGQQVTLGTPSTGTLVVTIIGVLQPTGLRADQNNTGIIGREIDLDLYFPLTLSRKVFGDTIVQRRAGSMDRSTIELSQVWIKAKSVDDVERIAGVAENMVGLPGRQDAMVKAPIEILRAAERTQLIFNIIMVGIASLSLLVGGIGIMNIMLATVTERTREIGIRRALGAKQGHITLQFLIETTVISLGGGLLGITLGVLLAVMIPPTLAYFGMTFPTSVTTWSILVSFGVSGLIGIGFGMYPAMRAARMDPIEALRTE